MKKTFLNSHAYWEKAWQEARRTSLFRRNEDKGTLIDFWNSRANDFRNNTIGKKGQKRVDKIFAWLEQQGVVLEGAKILDIGAGPGSFALPMVVRGAAQVVALEPADTMVEFLNELVKEAGYTNIQVIQKMWEEIEVDSLGLVGQFDLVFPSGQ